MGAISRRAALAAPAAVALMGAAPGNPDAELIRRCAVLVEAYRAHALHGTCEEGCRFGAAMEAAEEGLVDVPAYTFAGLRAKALVAAHMAQEPDGTQNFADYNCGGWTGAIVRDFLRLTHGSEPAAI